jgi:predicted DNA-binding transcriptional regulator YafY
MRASRLVSLLLLLQTRGHQTAAELARELEVSVRTVYRDVEALSESGVPIYAERGPHGGVRLVEGYRTRLTGLTEDEAQALFLSGLPGPAAELGLGTVVAAARLKVLAALPPELRVRATRITQYFHLDAPGWFTQAEPVPALETLAAGVWESRLLEIDYDRGSKEVRRQVEPLGLVLKAGVWYLVARSSGQHRTYRVSRVLSARLLEDRFERPEDFDLAAFWSASMAAFRDTFPRATIELRVVEERRDELLSFFRETLREPPQTLEPSGGAGWVRLRLTIESLGEAHRQLLRFGSAVEVLEPPELRERLVDTARQILDRYAGGDGQPVASQELQRTEPVATGGG